MARDRSVPWTTILALMILIGCGDSTYEPTPARLVGEFSGRAGVGFQIYDLFLTVQQVDDSVRGLWTLAFVTTCSTHDGPFSGVLDGDQIRLRLRPDEAYEATLDVAVRVLPGDSVLNGRLTLAQLGGQPLCFDEFAPITLHRAQ